VRRPRALAALTSAVVGAALTYALAERPHAQTPATPDQYTVRMTPARVAAILEAHRRGLRYIPGEVVLRFRSGVTQIGQTRALQALRSRPTASALQWIGSFAVLRDTSEPDPEVLVAQLRRQPEVAYAEPNYLYRLHTTPNDPGFSSLQWNLSAIDMPRAWDINPGGKRDIIVAIVDTGVTTTSQAQTFQTWNGTAFQTISVPFATNPDLSADRLVAPKDFIFGDGPVLDMVGHGTHVSATVGEDADNNVAEAGIAYRVRIMPVKVCFGFWDFQFAASASAMPGFPPLDIGGCPLDSIVAGIRYAADNGAKVINLSLGFHIPSSAVQEALRYAIDRGAFIAISAGNSFEDGNPVEYPAADAAGLNGAMSVGAVGRSLTRAFYSGTASNVEIAAPGGNFRDGGASGLIWQASLLEDDFEPEFVLFPRFNRYTEVDKQGTSMAAPHVAALAALLMSQGVTKPAAVEALIKATARDLGPAGRDAEFGFGLIQPRTALRGFGFVTR